MGKIRGTIWEEVAKKLNIDYDQLIKESIKHYLHKKLVEIRAEKHKLTSAYGVSTAREIDEKYKRGELDEEGTWEDFFRIDHLEYEEKEIMRLIEKIG